MGEFTPIETQEQLNDVIKDRLARERAKYADYEDIKLKVSDYEKQLEALNGQIAGNAEKTAGFERAIAEKDAIIRAHELRELKAKVAKESDLGFEAIEFLQGDDAESLQRSADSLKQLMNSKRPTAPQFVPDGGTPQGHSAAILKMAQSLSRD